MTQATLTGRVVEAFRAVRWPAGEAYCRRCHSEGAVEPASAAMTRPPDLETYHCRPCRYYFTDLTGTVLEKTSRPLWLWAWIVLGGDPATVQLPVGRVGSQRTRLRDMAERLRDTALAKEWKPALLARDVRRQDLEPLVEGWAAGHGNKPRGRHAHGKSGRLGVRGAGG